MATSTTVSAASKPVKGAFIRPDRTFRSFVRAGADPETGFPAEPNRYHLYVCHGCPWANRTLIVLNLKGLQNVVSFDVVGWERNPETSWDFRLDRGSTGDRVNGSTFLRELYFKADPAYNNTFTVPVLWDKKKKTIVNHESSEIIRMLNSEFNEFAAHPEVDLYPERLRQQIDSVNEWVYPNINNAVYRCGFARTQEAYDVVIGDLFKALDRVETILSRNRYLAGDQLTEADVRLFTTLIRFDVVYYTLFKTNLKHIYEYPNMWGWLRELYAMPEFHSTVDFEHIKNHYFVSLRDINPFGVVPRGPLLDYSISGERKLVPVSGLVNSRLNEV